MWTTIGILYIGFSILFTTIWTGIWLVHSKVDYGIGESPLEVHKLFSPMLPTIMMPNYYKGKMTEGISVSTMITKERLPKLKILMENYNGPVSCVLHLNSENELTELMGIDFTTSQLDRLSIHVIIDDFDRQFNLWRNIAKYYAASDVIIMLDIDFFICNVDELLNGINMDKIRNGNLFLFR